MRPEVTRLDSGDGRNPDSSEPGFQVASGPTPITAAGTIAWPIFLSIGVVSASFFWVFWSIFFAFLMRQDFLRILLGPGLACGLAFGTFFGVYLAILMKPATTTFPVGNVADFLVRFDSEMAKLRYQPSDQAEGTRSYSPRTLFRPHAFDIIVQFGPAQATLNGPSATIMALKKGFEG